MSFQIVPNVKCLMFSISSVITHVELWCKSFVKAEAGNKRNSQLWVG